MTPSPAEYDWVDHRRRKTTSSSGKDDVMMMMTTSVESPSSPQEYCDYTSDWAMESLDFSSLQDDDDDDDDDDALVDKPMGLSKTDCISYSDTLSTTGESASWGSSCEYHYHHEPKSTATQEEEEDSMGNFERSLTMDDLRSFYVEDQVGVFDPKRDHVPPPKARTDFKGDSQNSFTLDDLTDDLEDAENDTPPQDEEGSLGCLVSSSSPTSRRPSIHRRSCKTSKRKSSLLAILPPPPLKGILKNKGASCDHSSNNNNKSRRSSSLTLLLMEDSNMLQLSLSGRGSSNDSWGFDHGVWSRFQESFSADQDVDYDKAQENHVQFSTLIVHEHALMVGDNPSVREGVPLSMAWKAQSSTTYETVDAYEGQRAKPRAGQKAPRRLDSEERMFRLLNSGVSLQDMQQAEIRTNQARCEREATKQQHLLLQGGLHTKTTMLFWKALQRREDSDEDDEEIPPRRQQSPPSRTPK